MTGKTAIVVGAGIVGLATARALAIRGYAVSVYEKNHRASGASVRNFGMIWPVGQPAGRLYERAIYSRDCWREIGDKSGIWYDPVGSLHVAYHPDEWQVLQETFEAFTREGREVSLLNPSETRRRSPVAKKENCFGSLYCTEEVIVDPRQALDLLPAYFEHRYGIDFYWGKMVTQTRTGSIRVGSQQIGADLIFICSGSDFETLYPDEFSTFALTKCKLQMMRMEAAGIGRIGPAICGGLSLIHYSSFKVAPSLPALKARFEEEMAEFLQWGIHVMISQNQSGQLTVGDSHEYGPSPDPFDRQHINNLILQYLPEFTDLPHPKVVETWNGVYGKFTDGQTELFFSPETDVYVLNGVGGAGMTLSFGFAEEMIGYL